MRTIDKGDEPPSLTRHRRAGGVWENYAQADDARHALLAEQGHLCAFCMGRIEARWMKVAHWAAQSDHGDRTVDWDNLLGACMGGDRQRHAVKHCDTAQGKTALKLHPADRAQRCDRLVRYYADGRVGSDDPEIHQDLDRTLNLNCDHLREARKRVHDVLTSRLQKIMGPKPGPWPRDLLERELEAWTRRDREGMLREHCQVAIYHLGKKIRK